MISAGLRILSRFLGRVRLIGGYLCMAMGPKATGRIFRRAETDMTGTIVALRIIGLGRNTRAGHSHMQVGWAV